MLRTDRPVFMGAISDWFGGHAWVIDGSLQRKRTLRFEFAEDGDVSTREEYTPVMLHCNWGWGGKCDGYYTSGVFNLSGGPAETEPGLDNTNP
jgi:hypothetical protein